MTVYAAWNKDKKIRLRSTSGGVFTVLAEYVLEKGGYVCGAVVDYTGETPTIRHIVSNQVSDMERMRGSKYVQSNLGNSYSRIRQILENEVKMVLFSGTPCQVAGLKRYLGNTENERLITVDILCHGVSSPLIFHDYCVKQQKSYQSTIKNVNFRYKKPGWIVFSMYAEFENGQKYIKDKFTDRYLIGFLNDMYARRSCQNCPYTSLNRTGDFTIADFWGYKSESFTMRNDEKGISIVIVNTNQASEIWQKINQHFLYQEHDVQDILGANRSFQKPWERNAQSEEFWKEYHTNGWEVASEKYCKPGKLSVKARINFLVYQYWFLIPKRLLLVVKRFRNR